jgi:hypothetical protein
MTHLTRQQITHSDSKSGSGKTAASISLGMMMTIAGLVVGLVACFDDCFGREVKLLILIITAGLLVTLAAIYGLYKLEMHKHPHIVNPLIAFLMGTLVVLVFEICGGGR